MSKVNDNKGTIVLVAAAMLLLVAIVFYAWGKTGDNETTGQNAGEAQTEEETTLADATKLGPNEINLTPDNFDSEIVKSDKLAIVDVYLPTCPHCQKVAPILTELSNEYVGKVKFGKMNASLPAIRDFVIKEDSNFQYVPAFWIYKDGKKVESFSGERSKVEFKAELDKYLK